MIVAPQPSLANTAGRSRVSATPEKVSSVTIHRNLIGRTSILQSVSPSTSRTHEAVRAEDDAVVFTEAEYPELWALATEAFALIEAGETEPWP